MILPLPLSDCMVYVSTILNLAVVLRCSGWGCGGDWGNSSSSSCRPCKWGDQCHVNRQWGGDRHSRRWVQVGSSALSPSIEIMCLNWFYLISSILSSYWIVAQIKCLEKVLYFFALDIWEDFSSVDRYSSEINQINVKQVFKMLSNNHNPSV